MKTYRTKTFSQKTAEIQRNWHLIDAEGKVLGQVATQIAATLTGKTKPTYTPHIDGGDYVVLVNAAKIEVTGNKATAKIYARHSNYPGGFTKESYSDLMLRQPEAIIRKAVKGMLPKNRLQDARLNRLKVFADGEHTYSNYIK